jgi:hypothetical protein
MIYTYIVSGNSVLLPVITHNYQFNHIYRNYVLSKAT